MTSPPPLLTSAEHSSEVGDAVRTEEAAQALRTLQTEPREQTEYLPPTVSSAGDTPLSSVPPSPPQVSVAYGSPYLSGNAIPPLRSQELPSRPSKRTASSAELRPPKSRRNSQGSREPSNITTSLAGAQFTPASHHHAPNRISSGARAPTSVGPKSLTQNRESQAGKRRNGRSRKEPLHLADPQSSTGAHVDDDGDVPMSMLYPHPRTIASVDLPFLNTFKVPGPHELRFAGPSSSSGYREQAGASFPNSPSSIAPSPHLPTRDFPGSPFFTAPRSAFPRPRLSPSRSFAAFTLGSPSKPLTPSSSFDLPYGSPGVRLLPPSYDILPRPNLPPLQQAPVQASVEADGYTVIPNAISLALIREVVGIIDRGLPVNAESETARSYVLPVQAYLVRDEFVSNWRQTLRPFYDPMGKAIPKMPATFIVGAFKESDPMHLRQSLLHAGNKDQVYVHIALTKLSPETGFYNILRGSHRTKHPSLTRVNDWSHTPITLEEGDAIIWRGDVSYLLSPNGGGRWQCLSFDWGPGMVDLTNE